jgi:hypothetical protein
LKVQAQIKALDKIAKGELENGDKKKGSRGRKKVLNATTEGSTKHSEDIMMTDETKKDSGTL